MHSPREPVQGPRLTLRLARGARDSRREPGPSNGSSAGAVPSGRPLRGCDCSRCGDPTDGLFMHPRMSGAALARRSSIRSGAPTASQLHVKATRLRVHRGRLGRAFVARSAERALLEQHYPGAEAGNGCSMRPREPHELRKESNGAVGSSTCSRRRGWAGYTSRTAFRSQDPPPADDLERRKEGRPQGALGDPDGSSILS